MAGRGPAPKDPAKRARRNKDAIPTTVLPFKAAPQPKLPQPPRWLGAWPAQTRKWWERWGESPQAALFSAVDWDFLVDTALIHAQVWKGDTDKLGELRLRVAKFGATMEDRARLRIQFAQADDADGGKGAPGASSEPTSARERYGDLVVFPGGRASGS